MPWVFVFKMLLKIIEIISIIQSLCVYLYYQTKGNGSRLKQNDMNALNLKPFEKPATILIKRNSVMGVAGHSSAVCVIGGKSESVDIESIRWVECVRMGKKMLIAKISIRIGKKNISPEVRFYWGNERYEQNSNSLDRIFRI